MKVIDLLNKIANKEDLPKRIKYKSVIYGLKGTLYINDDETDRLMDFLYADFRNLNDEVEIIEDEEKTTRNVVAPIEKIKELILVNHPEYKNLKLKDKKTIVNWFAYFDNNTELLEFLEYMDED